MFGYLKARLSLKYHLSSGVVCADTNGTCSKRSVTPGSLKKVLVSSHLLGAKIFLV